MIVKKIYQVVLDIKGLLYPRSFYMDDNLDYHYEIENEVEGSVLIGSIKDFLANYHFTWKKKQGFWLGQTTLDNIGFIILLAIALVGNNQFSLVIGTYIEGKACDSQ